MRTLRRPHAVLACAQLAEVLNCDELHALNEETILDNTISWAQLAGRTDEVIAKVMPLVRWPLVPLVQLKAPLKALMKRCPVVKELVEEAIGLQMQPEQLNFTPKRHRLMDGSEDTDIPRHKRRNYCTQDKVQPINASALVAAML